MSSACEAEAMPVGHRGGPLVVENFCFHHTLHAPCTKTECDYLYGSIFLKKKRSHTQKSPKNGEPHKYSWERRKRGSQGFNTTIENQQMTSM